LMPELITRRITVRTTMLIYCASQVRQNPPKFA